MPTLAEILARKAGASQTTPAKEGIKITPEAEKQTLAASIKATLDLTAPKPAPPLAFSEERELGATEKGERLPVDHPAANAPLEEWQHFDLMHSFQSDLGIVIDPNGESAWIACQVVAKRPPLLLFRLPLLNRPAGQNPF